jgi:hypothetical protein
MDFVFSVRSEEPHHLEVIALWGFSAVIRVASDIDLSLKRKGWPSRLSALKTQKPTSRLGELKIPKSYVSHNLKEYGLSFISRLYDFSPTNARNK